MYQNMYCKRKCENTFNPYPVLVPVINPDVNVPFVVSTQKLRASAAPFVPKKLMEQQLNEVMHEEQTESKDEVQPQNNADNHSNEMPSNETSEMSVYNDQAMQYGNMPPESKDEVQPQNNADNHSNEMPSNETSEMSVYNDQAMQYGNMPSVEMPTSTNDMPLPMYPASGMQLLPQMQEGVPNENIPYIFPSYHPLSHIWTLWYLEPDPSMTFEEMQTEVSSVKIVEDFGYLCQFIKTASEIKTGCDYSLFKKGIRPMWEDEANREGGRWILYLPRYVPKELLDKIWFDTQLCLIGNCLGEHTEQICGGVLSVRSKYNKISVWTTNGQDSEAILEIGCKWRDTIHLGPNQLHYKLHKDTMLKAGGPVPTIHLV